MPCSTWRPIPILPPAPRTSRLDLELNQLTTVAVLEAMQAHGVKRLFFASTSAIFGETDALLHEDFAPLQPISFYGASKLAAEAYISVFAHTFGGRAVVLRFPNVVGERATHGVIYDFLRKLEADPQQARSAGRRQPVEALPLCRRSRRCGAHRLGQGRGAIRGLSRGRDREHLGARDRRNRGGGGRSRGHAHRLYRRRSRLARRCAALSLRHLAAAGAWAGGRSGIRPMRFAMRSSAFSPMASDPV